MDDTSPERSWHGSWIAPLLLCVLSLLYCFPLLRDLTHSCRGDWDYFQALYEAQLASLVSYRQLPLWNPYFCGGMPLLANPQVSFPSLASAVCAVAGVMAGLKFSVWLHTFLGMYGTYLVARTLVAGRGRHACQP